MIPRAVRRYRHVEQCHGSTRARARLLLPLQIILSVLCLHYTSTARAKQQTFMPTLSQKEALLAFKQSLRSSGGDPLPSWKADTDPCSEGDLAWVGVTCVYDDVVGLDLSGMSLRGPLLPALANLNRLDRLDLSDNQFFGALPKEWSLLTGLEELVLSHNLLSGTMPESWGSMVMLKTLSLSNNSLEGPLPPSWGGMYSLYILDLDNNKLDGSLPPSWGRMTALAELMLQGNQLSGTLPKSWRMQSALLQLDVSSNLLEGPLPPQWAQGLESLRSLNLANNSFTGPLPSLWYNLTSLQYLNVEYNQLSGVIPESWSTMKSIFRMEASGNRELCGYVAPTLQEVIVEGNTTMLQTKCIWEDDARFLFDFLSAAQPSAQLFPKSWDLQLDPCGIDTWEGVGCVDGRVAALNLSNYKLEGQLSPGLLKVTTLVEVYLGGNKLSGNLTEEWAHHPALRVIDLSGNLLDGPLPDAWSAMHKLRYLNLSKNRFFGHLPSSWGTALRSLAVLILEGNYLSGPLPPEWSGMLELQVLDLGYNLFESKVPQQWGTLQHLKTLILASNRLDGSLPRLWGNMSKLETLNIEGNTGMCGPLPPTLEEKGIVLFNHTQVPSPCPADATTQGATLGMKGITIVVLVTVGVTLGLVGFVYRRAKVRERELLAAAQAANMQHHSPTTSAERQSFSCKRHSSGTPGPHAKRPNLNLQNLEGSPDDLNQPSTSTTSSPSPQKGLGPIRMLFTGGRQEARNPSRPDTPFDDCAEVSSVHDSMYSFNHPSVGERQGTWSSCTSPLPDSPEPPELPSQGRVPSGGKDSPNPYVIGSPSTSMSPLRCASPSRLHEGSGMPQPSRMAKRKVAEVLSSRLRTSHSSSVSGFSQAEGHRSEEGHGASSSRPLSSEMAMISPHVGPQACMGSPRRCALLPNSADEVSSPRSTPLLGQQEVIDRGEEEAQSGQGIDAHTAGVIASGQESTSASDDTIQEVRCTLPDDFIPVLVVPFPGHAELSETEAEEPKAHEP